MEYELKIPKERIAVLIGNNGSNKKDLEIKCGVKIDINSDDGDVFVSSEDSFKAYISMQILKAISRGFNPDVAKLLLNENYILEVIKITDFSGKSKLKQKRLKGRVIGVDGKARKTIEKLTNTNISVYGKTVGIIGEARDVELAARGIESILSGAPHGPIFKSLEERKKEWFERGLKDEQNNSN